MTQHLQDLRYRYRFPDFLYYICLLSVPVLTAFLGIVNVSAGSTAAWALFGLALIPVMLRFFCTHCPHYHRDEKRLKCMFFWGLPKLFAHRPGRFSTLEICLSIGAPALFFLAPLIWLAGRPGLLAVYVLSLAGFGATVYRNECRRCVHIQCPANRVPESKRHSVNLP